MQCCCAFPDLSRIGLGIANSATGGVADSSSLLLRPRKFVGLIPRRAFLSLCCVDPELLPGWRSRRRFGGRLAVQVKQSGDGKEDGGKDVQDLLVDLLRLETGKVRVNEFVEDRSKFLTGIVEQANEEFDRIAEEAKKTMDEAGSKVLEQLNAEAAGFEEELAAARAEMEANERDLNDFEKNIEQARSEGLFFKSLYSKPSKTQELMEIKEKASVVTELLDQGTKRAAGSKFSRIAYVVMIVLVVSSLFEAFLSENVQWTKLIVYIILLVALIIRLNYESTVSTGRKGNGKK